MLDKNFWYFDQRAQDSSGLTREQMSLMLMNLNKKIFGFHRFKINDTTLFNSQQRIKTRFLHLVDNGGGASQRWVEETLTIWWTTYEDQYEGQVHGCEPGEEHCNEYDEVYHQESFTYQVWIDDVYYDPYYNPSGAGGGTSGGGGGTGGDTWEVQNDPGNNVTVNPNNPCDGTDQYSGATATLQYTGLKPTVAQFALFNPNITNQAEQYFLVNDVNGSYVPGVIQTLSTTGGSMQGVTSGTVMVVHTHPYGGFPAPSPADFFGLANFTANFQMNYVIAYDGTKYAMVVNNYSQLQAFVSANSGAIGSDGEFIPNATTAGNVWWEIVHLLGQQGYTDLQAYERALAYIMKQAGVTLVKANAGSDTFKKIGIQQKVNADGTPAVNGNGDPIFENADCI